MLLRLSVNVAGLEKPLSSSAASRGSSGGRVAATPRVPKFGCLVDGPWVHGTSWVVRGDGSRRRRGYLVDSPRGRVASTPRQGRPRARTPSPRESDSETSGISLRDHITPPCVRGPRHRRRVRDTSANNPGASRGDAATRSRDAPVREELGGRRGGSACGGYGACGAAPKLKARPPPPDQASCGWKS